MHYGRFFAMIATSTAVMFVLMYLNTYLLGHVFWSETRAYMAIVMGATMAFVMLAFMRSMYSSRMANIAIFAGSVIVFGASLWLVRSQVTVEDRSFMSAMIPHHSIAIMTSTRANITDPRVRTLADDIIFAQDKEIAEMRYLIADIDANGKAAPEGREATAARLVDADEALSTEVVSKVDPEFMTDEEVATLFPNGGTCAFTYTKASPPVLVVGETADGPTALTKISGDLVQLSADGVSADGGSFEAAPLSANILPTDEDGLFDLTITAGSDYTAGFRGQYTCSGS